MIDWCIWSKNNTKESVESDLFGGQESELDF